MCDRARVGENGNHRAYVFTFPNPTQSDEDHLREALDSISHDVVIGREIGSGGLRHLQGCVRLKKPMRFDAFRRLVAPGHVEVTIDHEAAVNYCRKGTGTSDRPRDPDMLVDRYMGIKKGHRSDLDKLVESLTKGGLQAAKEDCPHQLILHPAGCRLFVSVTAACAPRLDLRVVVYTGAPGIGKSRAAQLYQPAFLVSMPKPDDKLWFTGYVGQPHLIIDEMNGQIDYRQLMQILDVYPYKADAKYGEVEARWTKVTITSNTEPDRWYPKEDYRALHRRLHGIFHAPPWDYPGLPYPYPGCPE